MHKFTYLLWDLPYTLCLLGDTKVACDQKNVHKEDVLGI